MAWSSVSGLGNRFRSVLVHLSPRGKGPTLSRVGRASRYTRSLCHLSPYIDPADQARLYWVVDREAIQHRGLLLRQWWSEWRGVEKVTVLACRRLSMLASTIFDTLPRPYTLRP